MENNTQNFVSITSIEILDYTEDVYDITVEDNHNFYANGLLVHNCIGGPLAYEVLSRFQEVEFDDLQPSLLDNDKIR